MDVVKRELELLTLHGDPDVAGVATWLLSWLKDQKH
jgi:hypothetical protein